MEKELLLNETISSKELTNEKEQTGFLQNVLGQAINFAVDTGIRAILPNFVEDAVIDIKNTLITEGLGEGISKVVQNGIDLGKSVVGIFTGKFDNVSQMQNAVEKGGMIEATSSLIDSVLSKVQKNKLLPKNVISIIKNGKNVVLDNVSKNIENALTEQSKEIEYKKLEKSLEKVVPLENTLKKAREIENLHNRIKNNGQNFELTDVEKELAKKLA